MKSVSDMKGNYKLTLLFLIALCIQPAEAYAESIPESKLLLAIVGEAEGLPIAEQQAITNAIINRGSLRGVYGYERVAMAIIAPKTLQRAKKALFLAHQKDITNRATHFLSNWDLKHCRPSLIAWHNKMKITLKTSHFTFYKRQYLVRRASTWKTKK